MIAVLTANKNTFHMWQYYMDSGSRKGYKMVSRTDHVIGITFTGFIKLNDWRAIPNHDAVFSVLQTRILGTQNE